MLSFFPRGVLDEILNLIESVSEDFPSYSARGKTNNEAHFKRGLSISTCVGLSNACKINTNAVPY